MADHNEKAEEISMPSIPTKPEDLDPTLFLEGLNAFFETPRKRLIDKVVFLPINSEPKGYSKSTKVWITILVSAMAAIDPLTVNIFYRK
jgi:hypothetical protein